MNKLNFYQKRDFGENVSFTFQFVKENFVHFFVNILVLNVPIWLVIGLGVYSQAEEVVGLTTSLLRGNISSILGVLIVVFVLALLWATYSYAIMYNYYILYMEKGPKGFNLQELFARAVSSMSRLLISNLILFAIAFVGGLLLVLISGAIPFLGVIIIIAASIFIIIYSIRISFYSIIIIKDKKTIWESIQQSIFLVKDHWWDTFGIFLVFGVIGAIISWIVEQLLGVLGANVINSNALMSGAFDMNTTSIIIYIIFNILTSVLASLFSTTAVFAQYGSLVEEKEGVHLKQNIDKFGTTPDNEKEEEDF